MRQRGSAPQPPSSARSPSAQRFSTRVPLASAPNAWTEALARAKERGEEMIDLTEANPTRLGLAPMEPAVIDALADRAGLRYDPDPRGLASARAAVAEYYAAHGVAIDPEWIVLTSGTSEGYAHAFRLLCDPGETVLVPQPSYPLFEPLAHAEGVRVRPYRLAYDGLWHLDFDSLERAHASDARAVLVVEPHHPTGSLLSPDERARLADWCARRGLAIVADEVFADFPRPGGDAALSWASERLALTLVLSGLSKVCGLPQMKVAWIALAGPAPDRARARDDLEWLADLFLSVSTPAQIALPRWLAGRHAFQARVRARIADNLATLESLVARRPEISLLDAAGGWVAVLELPARMSEEAWTLALLERGVVTHPGHFYDLDGGPHLVLSLIAEPRAWATGLERLGDLLARVP